MEKLFEDKISLTELVKLGFGFDGPEYQNQTVVTPDAYVTLSKLVEIYERTEPHLIHEGVSITVHYSNNQRVLVKLLWSPDLEEYQKQMSEFKKRLLGVGYSNIQVFKSGRVIYFNSLDNHDQILLVEKDGTNVSMAMEEIAFFVGNHYVRDRLMKKVTHRIEQMEPCELLFRVREL